MSSFDEMCSEIAYSSCHFFGQNNTPEIEKVARTEISKKTLFQQRNLFEYFYVRNGHGKININGKVYPLQRGCAALLSNYQLRQFIPEDGPLDLNYCHVRDGSIYVFWSCPYYTAPNFKFPGEREVQIFRFPQEALERIDRIWDEMSALPEKEEHLLQAQQVYLFMEYLGEFHRLCNQEENA